MPYYGHIVHDLISHDNQLESYFKCCEEPVKCLDIDTG